MLANYLMISFQEKISVRPNTYFAKTNPTVNINVWLKNFLLIINQIVNSSQFVASFQKCPNNSLKRNWGEEWALIPSVEFRVTSKLFFREIFQILQNVNFLKSLYIVFDCVYLLQGCFRVTYWSYREQLIHVFEAEF